MASLQPAAERSSGPSWLHEPARAATPPADGARRGARWLFPAAAALLVAHVLLAWWLRVPSVTTGNDDAMYLQLARSLRALDYREHFIVGAPWHAQYPPLYPAMLALVSAVVGERVDALLALNVLLSVVSLALLFDIARRRWSPGIALLVLALSAVNLAVLQNAGRLMSETPFMAFTVLAFWLLERRPATAWSLALGGAAAVCAALTRSAGVAIVAAVCLLWLIERRRRAALALAAAAALTVGAWTAWTVVAPQKAEGRSYIADATRVLKRHNPVATLALRPVRQARGYLTQSIPMRIPFPTVQGTLADNVFWLTVLLGCGAAGALALWKGWRVALLGLAAMGALLLAWPWRADRFIEPLLPLLLLTLLLGASVLGARWSHRAAWILPSILALVIGATSARQVAAAVRDAARCERAHPLVSPGCFTPDQRAFLATATWAREHTPRDAIFVGAKEGAFSYFSGRRFVPLPQLFAGDSAAFYQRLTGAGVQYVVIGNVKLSETRLIHYLLADCRRFALAASFPPSSLLLAVRPDGPASAEREACSALARHRDYLGGRGQPDEDTPADGSGGGVAGAALDAPPPM